MSSTIYFLLSLAFFLPTILSTPSPQIIYSAIIYNGQDSPIDCKVTWLKPNQQLQESNSFQIPVKKGYPIEEKTFDMGGWEARAIINKIDCGSVSVTAPFEGVTNPSVNWRFVVRTKKIFSIKPKLI